MNKNNIIYLVIALVAVAILIFAFSGRKANDVPENGAQNQVGEENGEVVVREWNLSDGNYVLDTEESEIKWEGRKPLITNYSDKGTLAASNGNFSVVEGQLVAGEIVINMDSLVTTEVFKGSTEGLTGHLRSEDFFDVETYPEAKIVLQSATPSETEDGRYELEAEMTIKDITNPVTIVAMVYDDNGRTVISGEAQLDRTLWDIRFGSGKFFENLADNMIDDIFIVNFYFVGDLAE